VQSAQITKKEYTAKRWHAGGSESQKDVGDLDPGVKESLAQTKVSLLCRMMGRKCTEVTVRMFLGVWGGTWPERLWREESWTLEH
jgi:hypothetical protein